MKTRLAYVFRAAGAGGFDLWTGDLNADGRADLVIAEHSSGNGLAAWMDTVSLVQSSKSGYKASSFFSFGFTPGDVLRWRGEVFVLGTQFIGGARWESGADAAHPDHSYWVHSFLSVRGSSLRPRPDLAPIWVWYMNRPNHHGETKARVSEAQRQRLWREQAQPWRVPHLPL